MDKSKQVRLTSSGGAAEAGAAQVDPPSALETVWRKQLHDDKQSSFL